MAIVSQWQSTSDEDWALALARESVIRPLTDQPEVSEELVVTASAELGISRSMVYRLVAKFRKRPQVSSLLPGQRGRKASARDIVKCCVSGRGASLLNDWLGGLLGLFFAIDESNADDDLGDEFKALESTPMLLGFQGEFKDHRQGRDP